jgi:hypothetical protein
VGLADEAAALAFLVENEAAIGLFNLTAPTPCTMGELAAAIGRALGRPSWLPAPALALRLALGQMAEETVLASQRAVPSRLLALGFEFAYNDLAEAVSRALGEAPTARKRQ